MLAAESRVPALRAAAAEEATRQDKSFKKRSGHHLRLQETFAAEPPTDAELRRSRVFLDSGGLFADLRDAITSYEGLLTDRLDNAVAFIAENPWQPSDCLVTFAAILRGAWVIRKSTYILGSGVALKYSSALNTRRKLWVSEHARAQFPAAWLLILELLSVMTHKWTLLGSAAEFAAAKAWAEHRKK